MAPDVVAETVDDLREALLPTQATNSGSR
jgi:hypothetical protein